jgi:hypothetical protein
VFAAQFQFFEFNTVLSCLFWTQTLASFSLHFAK